MSFAIDVNILLYATNTESPYHEKAKHFLEQSLNNETLVYFTWPTLMAYLRIVTHPSIMARPLTPGEATSNIGTILDCPHVRVLAESQDFWLGFCKVTREVPARGNQVPDAHVAAILLQHGVNTIYTRDRDFRRFTFLKVVDPTE